MSAFLKTLTFANHRYLTWLASDPCRIYWQASKKDIGKLELFCNIMNIT